VSKEEKQFGKVLAKSKNDKAFVSLVQNAVFPTNANITLREAVASNTFSKNITWDIEPAEKKGAYIISFSYDLDPIGLALSTTNMYEEKIGGAYPRVNLTFNYGYYRRIPNEYSQLKDSIVSPVGISNMFTRFLASEITNPTSIGMDEEMRKVLDDYMNYKKEEGYDSSAGLIHISMVPDSLPNPYFDIRSAKFIGKCFVEPSSPNAEFIGFSLLFNFRIPSQKNKEYKDIGLNVYSDDIPGVKYHDIEYIEITRGLDFVYEDQKIFELYPFACSPIDSEKSDEPSTGGWTSY
jgi:hypothetical protein